jgi:pSer/pThr/pTyr-binding forkhead associated (FHA) protein
MSGERLLKVRLTLKGRPVRTYVFRSQTVSVGRNPEADIFLDNPGVSREHLKLHPTVRGTWVVEDLGSANGTIVNEARVVRHELAENDIVHVGKFSLWVSYEEDRRQDDAAAKVTLSNASEGTTVLSVAELQEMMHNVQRAEAPQKKKIEREAAEARGEIKTVKLALRVAVLVAVLCFVLGSAAGIAAARYLLP